MRRIVHLAAFLAIAAAVAALTSRISVVAAGSDLELVLAVIRRAALGEPSLLSSPWFLRPLAFALLEGVAGVLGAYCLTRLLGMGDNDTYGYAIASGVGRTTAGAVRIGWVVLRVAVAVLVVLLAARYMLLAGTTFDVFR